MDAISKCTHHAVLIGINAYKNRPLRFCVQDVHDVKKYLEESSNFVNIKMFTAVQNDELKPDPQISDSSTWPTYEKVTAALDNIVKTAEPGSCVLIHYSGHGVRASPNNTYSNQSTGDLALVLLHSDEGIGERYLWGSTLAVIIESMVSGGLHVTLVLDCCFSAAVYRADGNGVRCKPYDPKIHARFPLEGSDNCGFLQSTTNASTNRGVSMSPNWRIPSEKVAILSACGPHELAREFVSQDGQGHGALSYFLLRSLRECGVLQQQMKFIYDDLRAKFRKHWPTQNPVFYGNKNQGFFGLNNGAILTTTFPVVMKQHGQLELLAGQAHGICVSDVFLINLQDSTLSDDATEVTPVTVQVGRMNAFTADLTPIFPSLKGFRIKGPAQAISRLRLRDFPILLVKSFPSESQWLKKMKERSLNVSVVSMAESKEVLEASQQQYRFRINLSNNAFEVCNSDISRALGLPTAVEESSDVVLDILEHFAKFELVKDLINDPKTDLFRESFAVEMSDISGNVCAPGEHIRMEPNKDAKHTMELKVQNRGNSDIYVHVYNLGPFWQVQNILCGTYEVVPPRNNDARLSGVFRKKLKTLVPSEITEAGQRDCKDIVKVFITSQPTSFDSLELPRVQATGSKRKAGEGKQTRNGDLLQDWAAMNFYITTYLG